MKKVKKQAAAPAFRPRQARRSRLGELTVRQFAVLRHLAKNGPTVTGVLRRMINDGFGREVVTSMSILSMMKNLEKHGWVSRSAGSVSVGGGDGMEVVSNVWEVTPEGKEVAKINLNVLQQKG